MRVYRCITAREIFNKYKRNTAIPKSNSTLNTHIYDSRNEYVHFFRYLDFAKYYYELGKDGNYEISNENYVLFMVANIPNHILNRYLGYGFYQYSDSNFNFENNTIPIPEYAIPVTEFKEDYIIYMNNQECFFPLYSRGITEHQEFKRYLELINKLYLNKYNCHEIAKFLIENNLSNLLGVQDIDKTEEDFKRETENLLSLIQFPESNDSKIESIDAIKFPKNTDFEIDDR